MHLPTLRRDLDAARGATDSVSALYGGVGAMTAFRGLFLGLLLVLPLWAAAVWLVIAGR